MVLSCSTFSQNVTSQERDVILQNVSNLIKQAQNNIENSNYFEAQKKLESALETATLIDDKKSIGLINSKIGKIKYSIEEPDEAIKDRKSVV